MTKIGVIRQVREKHVSRGSPRALWYFTYSVPHINPLTYTSTIPRGQGLSVPHILGMLPTSKRFYLQRPDF